MKKQSTKVLRTAITEAARQAFTELRHAHPKETFYSFALYTSEEASYIVPTANTEEGLVSRARHYAAKDKKGLKEHMRLLRWSPADWAYHCTGEQHFQKAQQILDARPSFNDLDEDDFEKEVELRLETFIGGLKALDDEGFFGRGKARQGVTLLIAMGDQETKLLLRCAKQLNPAKVYVEFSKPFLRTTAGKFK